MPSHTIPDDALCLRETNFTVTSVSTLNFVPQPIHEKSHFVQNRIFVGGFPPNTSQKEMSDVFSVFGEIIEINIIQSDDGYKRYGFVTFRLISSADSVLSLYYSGKEFLIRGHTLNLSRALFKPKKQKMKSVYNIVDGNTTNNFLKPNSSNFGNNQLEFPAPIHPITENDNLQSSLITSQLSSTHSNEQSVPYQPIFPSSSMQTQSNEPALLYPPSLYMNYQSMTMSSAYNNSTTGPIHFDNHCQIQNNFPSSSTIPALPTITPYGGIWCCDPTCKFQ